MTQVEMRSYPRRISSDAGDFDIRLMTPEDRTDVLAFARALPVHDLLFLPRDISQPKVLGAWLAEIDHGAMTSLLAVSDDKVLGCGALVRDAWSWSPHVGELRVVVGADARGRGVGRALTQEIFALALATGLEKIIAQMTVDQQGAIAVFESLGFRAEALLRNQVRDRNGAKHDIVVLGHDVAQVGARMMAFGRDAVA
jgi:RimJ/RimL family protein N-acetyltransferase